MFTDNDIEIIDIDEKIDFEKIDTELRTLIITTIGTLPGNRDFGIEDFTDENTYDLESDFAAALDEGCEQFIPEISIERVEFKVGFNREMKAKIYVERRDED